MVANVINGVAGIAGVANVIPGVAGITGAGGAVPPPEPLGPPTTAALGGAPQLQALVATHNPHFPYVQAHPPVRIHIPHECLGQPHPPALFKHAPHGNIQVHVPEQVLQVYDIDNFNFSMSAKSIVFRRMTRSIRLVLLLSQISNTLSVGCKVWRRTFTGLPILLQKFANLFLQSPKTVFANYCLD